jgi:tRNA 2-thiouridine synthesizing protein A
MRLSAETQRRTAHRLAGTRPVWYASRVDAPNRLDLLGVPCPLSWAKAKVALHGLSVGALLELTLDDPRGARDLPRAAEAEGHHLLSVEPGAGCWIITLEK